jgi:hypothetical protein
MSPKRVKLYRTPTEWRIIESKIKESGKSDFNSFMRSEINKLTSKYSECPLCVTVAEGDKTERACPLTDPSYDILKEIAIKMQKPIASIIDDFIIAPLLMP